MAFPSAVAFNLLLVFLRLHITCSSDLLAKVPTYHLLTTNTSPPRYPLLYFRKQQHQIKALSCALAAPKKQRNQKSSLFLAPVVSSHRSEASSGKDQIIRSRFGSCPTHQIWYVAKPLPSPISFAASGCQQSATKLSPISIYLPTDPNFHSSAHPQPPRRQNLHITAACPKHLVSHQANPNLYPSSSKQTSRCLLKLLLRLHYRCLAVVVRSSPTRVSVKISPSACQRP